MKTIALVFGLLAAMPVSAATLTVNVSAVYAPDRSVPGVFPGEGAYSCSDAGESYAECTALESTAVASASYGFVWAWARAGHDLGSGESFGSATASFADAIVFSGPYQTALASFAYRVACEIDATSESDSRALASTGVDGCWDTGGPPAMPARIDLGVPFGFSATAKAKARTDGSRAGDVFGGAWLSHILMTDEDGNPLTGISITSESGTEYRLHEANLVRTPEPATSALVLGALLALSCSLSVSAIRRACRL